MLKKLYGLFIYKLQYTSFFSIIERVSGFFLLFVLYYFFLQEIFFNFFFYNEFFIKILYYLSLLFGLIFLFYFSFHFLTGIRIYITALYYNYNLNRKPLNLNFLYSLKLIEKNGKVYKFLITLFIKINEIIKNLIIKSNISFLVVIVLFFMMLILIFLL
jgi:succinate dehydrogenase/fumarate reductase cytochrome b subunit